MRLSRSSIFVQLVLAAVLVSTHAFAQSSEAKVAASSDEIMAHLKSQAAAEHKSILLTFGASWCGNCRLLDKFLADPAMHPILTKAFVFADLDAGEREGDKRHANTPGAVDLMSSLGGKEAGFPFIVMLDADGKLIANSLRPVGKGSGENTGYPDARYEIDWFMEMLKKAAPSLSVQEQATVRDWLIAHSSSSKH